MLRPLTRNATIKLWADTNISPGAIWKTKISSALARARVALLLVSPHFLALEFIADNELPPLLDAARNDGLTVLWIPISFSLYQSTGIGEYQAVQDPSKPLDSLASASVDKALVRIAGEIKSDDVSAP